VTHLLGVSPEPEDGGEQSTSFEANLKWNAGSSIFFTGTISSDIPTTLKVCCLTDGA
jgi:hypothetical protein